MRVGLVYNQKPDAASSSPHPADFYAEWDDAKTIQAIVNALITRHEVVCLNAAQADIGQALAAANPDMVFNIAEGLQGPGREAEIPMLLESLGIAYTGSGPDTLRLCLDKALTKRFLEARGIPTPPFKIFPVDSAPSFEEYPAIVKPNGEGSSKGIWNSSVVGNAAELEREVKRIWKSYGQAALIETYMPGREFTVGILGNGQGAQVLPIVEITLDCLPAGMRRIFSYEAKWIWDRPENPLPILSCPADITPELQQTIERLARKAFVELGCRDWCRVDFRQDSLGNLFVLEINPLPGILPDARDNSCLPRAAEAAGMGYADLILKVLDIAALRTGRSRDPQPLTAR